MAKGYMRVGKVGQTDLRVHWSAPIALLLWVLAFGESGAWGEVTAVVLGIYLAHGLGHWAVAKAQKFKVHRLEMGPLGVHAGYSGHGTQSAHTWVAFGGVMAHILIGMAMVLVPGSGTVFQAAVGVNLVLGAANLVPAGTLDGADGWPLAMGAARRTGHRKSSNQRARLVQEVDDDFGHPPKRRTRGRSEESGLQVSASEAEVPPDLVEMAELLMAQARRDAKLRTEGDDDSVGPAAIDEE